MCVFIYLFIFEGLVSFFIKDLTNNLDIVSTIFLMINTFVMIFVLMKHIREKDLFCIVLIGYILRVMLLLCDYFIFRIPPHSGSDTEFFHEQALAISINFGYITEAMGGIYSIFLGLFYTVFGPQRIMAQYLNTVLGIALIIAVLNIAKSIGVGNKVLRTICILVTFFPQNIIFSAILLREAIVGFFVILSIKYFIYWFKQAGTGNIVLSIIYLACGSIFHSGIAPAFLVYVFVYSFYKQENKCFVFTRKTVLMLGVFCILSVVIYARLADVLLGKFNSITSVDNLYNTVAKERGSSAYLTNISYNSIKDIIIFTPVKVIYFLFSPMPWDVRNIKDAISILLDSTLYFYLLFNIIFKRKKCTGMIMKLRASLFIIFIAISITFAYGTSSAGTAMRHRSKIFPLLLIIYSINSDEQRVQKEHLID